MIRLFLPQPWRKWGCPWKSGWACRLDRHGAAGSPAAPIWHQWYGQARGGEIRLLTDTDGGGVRVERGRQRHVGCRVVNTTIPGCFMENRLPLGGGWNNYEGGFIYCFFGV